MKRLGHRPGTAITLAAFGLALGAVAAPACGDGAIAAAAEIGITAESLTIAEVDTAGAATILVRIEEAQELRAELVVQRQLAAQAGAAMTSLLESLNQAPTDEALLSQYQAAAQDVATAKAAIQQLRQSLFETAMEGMPAERIEKVAIWREAAENRVPPEFRVRLRPAEQWRAIEQALRVERRAARIGQPVPEGPAQLLAEVRSDPLVVQAAYMLQAGLAEMEAVFAQP